MSAIKWSQPGVGSYLITLLLLPGFALSWMSPQANATGVDIAVAEVTLETVSREFRLDGSVEAVHKATMSAQTNGTIQKILVDVDDYVEKGTVIIQLKDVSQKAQLKKRYGYYSAQGCFSKGTAEKSASG